MKAISEIGHGNGCETEVATQMKQEVENLVRLFPMTHSSTKAKPIVQRCKIRGWS